MKAKNYGATIETEQNNIELSTHSGKTLYLCVPSMDNGRGFYAELTPRQVRELIGELTNFQSLQRNG